MLLALISIHVELTHIFLARIFNFKLQIMPEKLSTCKEEGFVFVLFFHGNSGKFKGIVISQIIQK